MKVTRIYRIKGLSPKMKARIRDAELESARVWNLCCDLHLEARKTYTRWPSLNDLHRATKGRFALHSQTPQMVARAFLAAVDATRKNRRNGRTELRYPYKDKRFYPLLYPAQAVAVYESRIVLPMGRGRKSIVLPRPEDFPDEGVGVKVVYDGEGGYELHATVESPRDTEAPGEHRATVDLGQIHQAAVTTDHPDGEALIVSGRGIRSEKRNLQRIHGKLKKKRSRCKKGSRRDRKLARAMKKHSARSKRRIRDKRHKGTRAVVDFCKGRGVGTLYVGNPDGVRKKKSGKKHNQRMSGWEYGQDIKYLKEKSERAAVECFTGTERGTSSRCPYCGHKQRPKGRVWRCRVCGFEGHRDLVGSANMHPIAYGSSIEFPGVASTTYLRPGTSGYASVRAAGNEYPVVGSSSSPDAGLHPQECLADGVAGEGPEGVSTRKAVATAVANGASYEAGAAPPAADPEAYTL